jgi:hypothetical protein
MLQDGEPSAVEVWQQQLKERAEGMNAIVCMIGGLDKDGDEEGEATAHSSSVPCVDPQQQVPITELVWCASRCQFPAVAAFCCDLAKQSPICGNVWSICGSAWSCSVLCL